MLTEFGKFLRKIRIDRGEIIKDMSEKLNVTASYLSAVETGKRNIPESWINEIAVYYELNENEKMQLKYAAESSTKTLKLNLEHVTDEKREAAILFAREFQSLDEETIIKVKGLLQKNRGKEENKN